MCQKTLILTRQDIEKLIVMPCVLAIVKKAFKAHGQGRTQMPAKIYLHLDKYNGDFRAMPAYIGGGLEVCGIKWVNVHPGNKKYGFPAVMAVIILSDPRTGFPLAIMDGTYITNLRTGAAGGIAAKYLANKGSKRIALVGCGVQAQTQLIALNELFALEAVSIYDCVEAHADAFINKTRSLGITVRKYASIAECVKGVDILVTTTPSRKPIIKSSWIAAGVHINAIGADAKGKEELEPALLKRAKVVVDDIPQAVHSGEINVPLAKHLFKEKDICGTLGEIIAGKKKGRMARDEITIFDSTGLAILDVAVAKYVYSQALKRLRRKKLRSVRLN